ncbi:MAG: hypothetical protein Q7R64_00745 [bacterium]|nr:hypothetical protein [bacterium]
MNAITRLFKFLLTGLWAGVEWVKQTAPDEAKKYLGALEKLTYVAIGIPTAFVALGFGLYFVSQLSMYSWLRWLGVLEPLWKVSVLTGGVCALVFGILLAIFAAPIGALISSATEIAKAPSDTTTTDTLPWYRWFSPIGSLREARGIGSELMQSLRRAIERYLDAVRFVLVISGFGFFFYATLLPRPSLLLLLLFMMGVSTIWLNRAYRTIWAWLAQAGVLGVMLLYWIAFIFPSLNPFAYYFGTSPKALTMEDLEGRTATGWNWASGNYNTPMFIALVVVLIAFVYVVTMLIRAVMRTMPGASTGGDTDHHTATASVHSDGRHGSSGGGSGRLMQAGIIALIALVLVVIGTKVLDFHERRGARIGAEEELRRIRLLAEEQVRVSTPRPGNGNGGTTATQTPTLDVPMAGATLIATSRRGLKNPKGYVIALSPTGLSEAVPCPPLGMHLRIEPEEFDSMVQIFVNGMKWDRIPGAQNIVSSDARFFQYLGKDLPPTNMIVWVGKKSTM